MQDASLTTTHNPILTAEYDVVVVGGGMVGAAAAIGLGQLGLNVAVIESRQPQAYESEQPLDLRVSAISVASELLLTRLGVMENCLPCATHLIPV